MRDEIESGNRRSHEATEPWSHEDDRQSEKPRSHGPLATPHTPLPQPHTPDPTRQTPPRGVSRRSFMRTVGLSAAAASAQATAETLARARRDDDEADAFGPEPARLTLRVNGEARELTIDPATTLMEALRWHTDLGGTKEVCDRGACGACSVLIDGALVASCMMLAYDAQGREITTVEGLGARSAGGGRSLDAVQEAFIRHDALQCGYCTPGLLMASKALLSENPRPTLEQIKRGLSGNICRCGTYTNVFNAVLEASGQSPIVDASVSREGA